MAAIGRPPSRLLQAGLLAAAAALAAFTILRAYGPHDEGLMLAWGGRIADGQWPYRDFWCNYMPGQPLVLAGLQEVFGPSLLAWRIVRVAVGAVVALLAYRLVRRAAGEAWALAAWVAVAAAMAWPLAPGPNAPAVALALGALLAAPRSARTAGVLAGLALAFRLEIGAAAVLGAMLAGRRGDEPRAAGTALVVAALALAPFAVAAGGDVADQTIGFLGVQDLQRLPLVPPDDAGGDLNKQLERLFPLLLVIGAGIWAAWALARRPPPAALAPGALVAVGLLYLLARADEFHLVPLSVALSVALAIAAGREERTPVRVALGCALAVVAVHGLERRAGELRHPPALAAVPGAVADGVRTSPRDARALARLLPAVHARASRDEPVLVAPPRFDRVRVGDPLLNVLLQRPNPTRYDVMQSGVVTTRSVQREMARDLVRSRAPVVVRWVAPVARGLEPNGSARSSGVLLLDRVIARRYRRVARFGDYVLLARRE